MAIVRTRGSRLNVRAGPGLRYPVVGMRSNGDFVDILERRVGWARIGAGQWVDAGYLRTDAGAGEPDEGEVIEHPRRPGNPRWRLLTGFATNRATLRPAHMRWLRSHAASLARAGQYVWARGMASRLGDTERNRVLSEQRAAAVRDFLVNECHVPSSHVTGVGGVGESWSTGSETDDSPRWRAVEIIITNSVVELPPGFVTGASPYDTVFWIKYMGSGSGGEVVGGDVALFLIRTGHNYWQRYMYVGGGITGGAPVSWGEALPAGNGWARFTARRRIRVDDFAGSAELFQAGAQVGLGVSVFRLGLQHATDRISVDTGTGFSLGASATTGRMMTAGDIQHSSRWRSF